MIYLPKYSVGSIVDLESGETGEVVDIEAHLKSVRRGGNKTFYFVQIEEQIKKVSEHQIKDHPEIEPKIINMMDKFLADSLLLTRHNNPSLRIDNTIKELLNLEVGGK